MCCDGRDRLADISGFWVALCRVEQRRFRADEHAYFAIVEAHVDMGRSVIVRVDHDDEFSDPNHLRQAYIIT